MAAEIRGRELWPRSLKAIPRKLCSIWWYSLPDSMPVKLFVRRYFAMVTALSRGESSSKSVYSDARSVAISLSQFDIYVELLVNKPPEEGVWLRVFALHHKNHQGPFRGRTCRKRPRRARAIHSRQLLACPIRVSQSSGASRSE